ncbi:MAG: hypothetical protein K2X81_04815, partial [Candidatus Obscuribacterales bacterium]|nr:hypothetical protein [Candidatus Obscuribacterales bacterium]
GAELGTFFFLLALYLYMQARQADSNWMKIAAVSIASFIAVSNSVLMWTSCLSFGLLELVYLALPDKASEKRDLTMSLIAALMPIVLVGMYIAATLGFNVNLVPEIQIKVISSCLRHMALPINEFNWQHYAAQYRFLYVIYPCLAISALAAMRVAELRRGILYAAMLCPILLFPLSGTSGIDSTLYCERWLYAASVPFCMLLGIFAAGLSSLKGRLRYPGIVASIVLALLLSNFFYRHLRNEIAANRNCARILKAAQKAMKESQQKGQLQIEIIRDLPKKLSVCPSFSPYGPVVFDSATGLMRSNQVPDGRLKDLLRENKMRENSLRWEMDLRAFLPLELQDEKATCPDNMKIEELAFRLLPKLEFYKNAKLNNEKTELTLEPVSDKGPIITFITPDYSPLDGEYIWLDAAIDAPISPIAPRIEMYWLTRLHPDFVKRERFTYAKANVNDGKGHRYLLSCRSNGWTTSGSMRCIVLGFPARSKVRISGIGITRQKILPTLTPVLENLADGGTTRFTPPYYNYPLEPQLGLIALSDKANTIIADYSVKEISGAAGVLAEISYPNQSFDDANSEHLSGQTFKTYRFKGVDGKIQIPTNELPGAGVYSIRVIATSPEGPYLGQFSDALSYQVPQIKKEY